MFVLNPAWPAVFLTYSWRWFTLGRYLVAVYKRWCLHGGRLFSPNLCCYMLWSDGRYKSCNTVDDSPETRWIWASPCEWKEAAATVHVVSLSKQRPECARLRLDGTSSILGALWWHILVVLGDFPPVLFTFSLLRSKNSLHRRTRLFGNGSFRLPWRKFQVWKGRGTPWRGGAEQALIKCRSEEDVIITCVVWKNVYLLLFLPVLLAFSNNQQLQGIEEDEERAIG